MSTAAWLKISLVIVSIFVFLQGIWFVLGSAFVSPMELPWQYWVLLPLWVITLATLIKFKKMPVALVIASLANLVGNLLLLSPLGEGPHSILWFLYHHSIETVLFVASCLAAQIYRTTLHRAD